jgi:hypothetical protein
MQNLIIGVILIALSIWVVSALPRIMQMSTLPANMGTTFNVPSLVGPSPTSTAPEVVPPSPVVQSPPAQSVPSRTTGTLLGQVACGGCSVEIYSAQGTRTTASPDARGVFRVELAPGDYVAQVLNGYADPKGFRITAGSTTSLVLGR